MVPGRTAQESECVLSHTEGPRPVLGLSSPQTGTVSDLEDWDSLGQGPGEGPWLVWVIRKDTEWASERMPSSCRAESLFSLSSAEKALVYSGPKVLRC